ncbi:uncharacterized protein Fhos isoform X2 [Prorops nasuta]|uniref:uncharacterized protein Fhos isoform X2 n=1 Tax=Prorops nasuta TaxID=863751 RepID=UPI0034CE79CE
MASYRTYNEGSTYRTRGGISTSPYGKNSPAGSNLPSFRPYTSVSLTTGRTAKDRATFTSGLSKDKTEDKSTYKYSYAKEADKNRLTPSRFTEETRAKSPLSSSRTSLLEKYSFPTIKTSERSSSVLDRYSRGTSREKSREPECTTRHGSSTYPGSALSRNYSGNDRQDRKDRNEHPSTSYRSIRTTSGRTSREPSPEVGISKTGTFRGFTKGSSYARSGTSGSSESSTPFSTRLGATTSSRFSLSSRNSNDRVPSTISYSGSDRFRASSKQNNVKEEEERGEKAFNKQENLAKNEVDERLQDVEPTTLTMVTRATSPTAPASSTFVRARRVDAGISSQLEVCRTKKNLDTKDQEVQCDRPEDNSRFARFGGASRVRDSGTTWSSYLDKYSSSSTVLPYRSYNSATTSTSRLGTFTGYTRSTESSNTSRNEAKVSPASSQELNNSDRRVQNDKKKVYGNFGYSKTSQEGSASYKTESKVEKESEGCECEVKIQSPENSSSISTQSSKTEGRGSSSRSSPVQKSEENNQRRPSIPRLGRGSSKSEVKTSKASLKQEVNQLKKEDRSLTPKSDYSNCASKSEDSSCKVDDASRDESSQTQKRDGSSSRKNSIQSESSQSRSGTPQRSGSSRGGQRQMTRADSSDGSSVSVPIGRLRSSSSGSVTSQGAKIKATPPTSSPNKSSSSGSSVNLRQSNSPDARGKPPVPKNESPIAMKATSAKYVNKDFRKSALNMENGDPVRSKYPRKRKTQRSVSVSSQDSQSEVNCEPRLVSSLSSNKCSGSREKSRSTSRSSRVLRTSGTSSCSGTSSSSSCSEEDEEKVGCRKKKRRPSRSPRYSEKGMISGGSSRTSVLASSTDEVSLTMDKPPRPPSSPRSKTDGSSKTEEAKSFLMRALAPVTNIFKGKGSQESVVDTGTSGGWQDASEDEINKKPGHSSSLSRSVTQSLSKSLSFHNSEHTCDRLKSSTKLSRQSSGERPWWLDSNSDNVPEGVEKLIYNDEASQDTTISGALPDDGKYKLCVWRQDSGERNWWLDPSDVLQSSEDSKKGTTVSPISRRGSSRESGGKSERRTRIRHQQSGERAWWLCDDPESVPDGVEVIPVSPKTSQDTSADLSETYQRISRIRHVESGEKAWWMDNTSNVPEGVIAIPPGETSNSDSSESYERVDLGIDPRVGTCSGQSLSRFPIEFPPPPPKEEEDEEEPLGDRASPEGIENPPDPPEIYRGESSPYENVQPLPRRSYPRKRPSTLPLFIGQHTNIDDLLGEAGFCHSPAMSRFLDRTDDDSPEGSSECEEIDATQVIIHDSTPQTPVIQRRGRENDRPQPDGYIPLDDTALQLYKEGDYGAYLDLEASISEQQEEFEGFQTNRKNSIVLRTQLSVRVHTIIEKLLNSEGRELRRALFSLKQIFQEDKDLVHEFVQNDGLACLIKVGSEADQNYQNYILRALGQVMLYVDGMNGVMEHGQTVQWLYTLIASRFRLVVKTALKLLLVFVEYVETNSLLLVRAVRSVDTSRGMIPWTNVMKLLKDYDAADTELLIYATTLVNKCLNGIPDQDTYYDQVDCLEEQGIEGIIQRYMSKQGTDLDLLRQFQIYEAVLQHEDGNDRGSPIRQLDDNIRKTLRNRKSLVDSHERRKSRRHSTGTSPLSMTLNTRLSPRLNHSLALNSLNNTLNSSLPDDDDESSSSQSSQGHLGEMQINGVYKDNKVDVGVTPALRRRRERAERQRSFIREQQEATASLRASIGHPDDQEIPFATNGMRYTNGSAYERNVDSPSNKLSRASSRKDMTPLMNAANKLDSEEKKPWYGKCPDEGVECDEGNHTDEEADRRVVLQLKRENTVKDLTQKLAAQNLIPSSPVEEKVSRIGDMSGLISKAKEGLAKSKSKADVLKSPTSDNLPKLPEAKKTENELHWEELVHKLKRPLALCDLDFTDLNTDDEVDVLGPVNITNGVPPPPPPMVPPGGIRAPPPPPIGAKIPPPLPQGPPPLFGVSLKTVRSPAIPEVNNTPKSPPLTTTKKNKKTVKLFWKEVRDDPIILSRLDKNKMIWDELSPVPVDTQKLEHLFESRAKDLITKKQQEMNKNKEIIVLDHKRSNAINIGMTKLPPPRSIKTAILKMDATIMNREGIEKLLTMLPTEEERSRIQEAQAANPDLPLGSAEQFLLTLASISELPARLKLWAFKLDFENSEKEIADPLMDLKQGMETLRVNKTFRGILSTLLSIGIFLNGNEVKGFQLEYLAKVPEVKDTVHKHSLLHHLCHMVMEKFPDSTDLYSEIGAVTRASKIDFDELANNIGKLESECKASWDHLKLIAKHDGSTMMKVKMSDFLADCAERIIVLGIVHRRVINRFHKFILWLGIPLHRVQDTKPNEFCRIVSEFALEYRTTRERVIQQLEKKANHRERNKTRGKMITEVGKFRTKEDRADAELRQLLGSDISDVESIHGTLPWRRQRKDGRTSLGPILRDESINGNLTDGDDELLESLVKTATKSPGTRTTPRERKRTRHADLKRSRTRENNTTPEGYLP